MIQVIKHLENKGYKRLNPDSSNVYGRYDDNVVYIVVIGSSRGLKTEVLRQFNNKIIVDIANNTGMRVELLDILFTPDGMFDDDIQDIVKNIENVWLFSEDYGKLYVFENQPDDFDGLYNLIDKDTIVENEKNIVRIKKLFGVVTPVLIIINVVIYFISSINMDSDGTSFVIRNLSDNLDAVINGHQYYRIFTAMFVHFSITHIVSNMVILLALGARMESLIGKTKMLVFYILTGCVASIASLISC
ncbi:MAG: rhomboid family intramembrane serine protease, partial [Coprococcus sp.]